MLRERQGVIGVEIRAPVEFERERCGAHDLDRSDRQAVVVLTTDQQPIPAIEYHSLVITLREVMHFPASRIEFEGPFDRHAADATFPTVPTPDGRAKPRVESARVGLCGDLGLQPRRAFPVAALRARGGIERGQIVEVTHTDQNGISSSKSARALVTGSPCPTSSSRTWAGVIEVVRRSPPPRSTIRSARISVVFRLTPSLSVYSLDWSLPSTYTCFPFVKYSAKASAVLPHSVIRCHSVRSCGFPLLSVHASEVAIEKCATAVPPAVHFKSASRPKFPIRRTLLSVPIDSGVLRYAYVAAIPSSPQISASCDQSSTCGIPAFARCRVSGCIAWTV